jgi:hypothetical protein
MLAWGLDVFSGAVWNKPQPFLRRVALQMSKSQGRERMSDAPGLCPVCGSQSFILEESVTDPWFGYPGAWRYDRCSSKKCGIAHIANPLTPEKLAEAYGNYYTHSASPPDKIEVALGRWIDRRNRRHGDKFPLCHFCSEKQNIGYFCPVLCRLQSRRSRWTLAAVRGKARLFIQNWMGDSARGRS